MIKPWQSPFAPQSNTDHAVISHRLDALERRIADIERLMRQLSTPPMRTMADAARWQHDGSGYGDVMDVMPPWVSNSARVIANLTSSDFGRQTRDETLLGGMCCVCLGGIVTLLGHLPWFAPFVIGGAGLVVTGASLVFFNRSMLYMAIRQQEKKVKKGELRVEVSHPDIDPMSYLFLNGEIDRDDLRQMAQRTLAGKSLAVHGWIGVGGWTRTKLDNFFAECEQMHYMHPGRGNKSRRLTPQGRALFKALAE